MMSGFPCPATWSGLLSPDPFYLEYCQSFQPSFQAPRKALLWVVYRRRRGGCPVPLSFPVDAILWGLCRVTATGVWLE